MELEEVKTRLDDILGHPQGVSHADAATKLTHLRDDVAEAIGDPEDSDAGEEEEEVEG